MYLRDMVNILNKFCAADYMPLANNPAVHKMRLLISNWRPLGAHLLLPEQIPEFLLIIGDFSKHVGGHIVNFQRCLVEFSYRWFDARSDRDAGNVFDDRLAFFGEEIIN